MSQENKEF
jgi:hypothetical protein